RTRRALLARIAGIAGRVPRHAQSRMNALVSSARAAAMATLPAGTEESLRALASSALPDEAWLRALGELACSVPANGTVTTGGHEVVALLQLRQSPPH